jgi:hypothetical protein
MKFLTASGVKKVTSIPTESSGDSFLQHLISLVPRPSGEIATTKDTLLVAVCFNRNDFDNEIQLGFAAFDTRWLDCTRIDAAKHTGISTSNVNVTTGKISQNDGFLFGESTVVARHRVCSWLKDRLKGLGAHDQTKLVFVGHDQQYDLDCMNSIGFSLPTATVSLLDTREIAAESSTLIDNTCTLEDLLVSLRCPFANLHVAGNRANLILKALLLLGVNGTSDHEYPSWIALKICIEEISRSPLPTKSMSLGSRMSKLVQRLRRKESRRKMKKLIPENGLEFLQNVLGLGSKLEESHAVQNTLLVAVDFENLDNVQSGFDRRTECQIGLALFDPGEALSLEGIGATMLIKTYNFVTGNTGYSNKAAKKFLFGETKRIGHEEVTKYLNSIVSRSKEIILVGHAVDNDVDCLEALGFDYEASVVAILDTQKIAVQTSIFRHAALHELLEELQCPFANLHSAGNDAHFALRALLLLATRCQDQATDSHLLERVRRTDILTSIAKGKLPGAATKPKQSKVSKKKHNRKRMKWLGSSIRTLEPKKHSRLTQTMLKLFTGTNENNSVVGQSV